MTDDVYPVRANSLPRNTERANQIRSNRPITARYLRRQAKVIYKSYRLNSNDFITQTNEIYCRIKSSPISTDTLLLANQFFATLTNRSPKSCLKLSAGHLSSQHFLGFEQQTQVQALSTGLHPACPVHHVFPGISENASALEKKQETST